MSEKKAASDAEANPEAASKKMIISSSTTMGKEIPRNCIEQSVAKSVLWSNIGVSSQMIMQR